MTNRARAIARLAAFCACVANGTALAQTNAPVITGRVLAADADTPLRRARIAVTAPPWRAGIVFTDDDGSFRIEVPAVGAVPLTITVSKGGYVTAAAKVERAEYQRPLVIRPRRAGAISGVAVDREGAPAAGITVTAARIGAADTATPTQYSTTTDDHGEFRLAGLTSGRYEVWAGTAMAIVVQPPRAPGAPVQPPTRHDVGTGPKAAITLEPAEEIGGVHLSAPDQMAADAALRALGESGRIPPNSLVTVQWDKAGTMINPATSGQPPQLRRGMAGGLRGRVLSATRKPVAGAGVRVVGAGVDQILRTDAAGAFSLLGIAAGQYTLQANAPGHMGWHFGQSAPGQAGRPVSVATDQVIEGIEFILPPGRAIHGFLSDEHGEPMEGATVQALELRYTAGRLIATPVGTARTTDDRGRYRLWGLLPGSYLVAAFVDGVVSGSGGQAAYARTYFPGTPSPAAAVAIDLRDDATANLAFTPSVFGDLRIDARDGDAPLVSGTARLVESRRAVSAWEPRVADVDGNGTFVFRNVPPGDYVVQVRGDGPGRTGLFGAQEVVVGAAPAVVLLRTSYGTTIEGRIAYEGQVEQVCLTSSQEAGLSVNANCPPRASSFDIGTVPLDDRARATNGVIASGSEFFVPTGLFGQTALALQRAPGDDWYLKSWTINGLDVADTGYDFGAQPGTVEGSEIVLSRNGAAITGRAGDVTKQVDDYFVVVFPTNREIRWPQSRRIKFTRSTIDGSFRIAGLPAGDYFVAGVSRLLGTRDSGEWQNPDVLLQLEARAEQITLAEGQVANLSLRLIER